MTQIVKTSAGIFARTEIGPGWIELGTTAPTVPIIDALREEREDYVHQFALQLPDAEKSALWRRYGMLPYKRYLEGIKHRDRWRRELQRTGELNDTNDTSDMRAFVTDVYDDEFHSPDVQGWVNYLCTVTPMLEPALARISIPASLPERERQMHTLITAGTGWGKSELMKALVFHYIKHSFSAVVVLDPHGDMVGQIARFREFIGSDRLVYIEPGLAKGYTVGLNPLDGRGLDRDACALYAAQLATALGELVADLTPNMQTLARNCLRVLLEQGDATLLDLVKLLAPRPKRGKGQPVETMDPRRAALVARGRQHRDPIVADFFRTDLDAESFDSSKAALRNRISSLLSIPTWAAMTCGQSTVNLQAALDARKVILVNLGPLGSEGGAAMGRLIVSMVAAIGRRREGTPPAARVPCHVFVDEASTMISPAMGRILAELRKYRVHLTLAQQVGGAGFDETGRRVLAANTGCKIVGSNNRGDLKAVFEDADSRGLPKLRPGCFWVRWGYQGEPQAISIRSDLADDRNAMQPHEWEAVRRKQLGHYRPAGSLEREPDRPEPRPPGPAGQGGRGPTTAPERPRPKRTLE